MFKVIFKTAVKAVFIVAILALIVFGVLSLGFPGTMADLCERTGNYSMATGYASLNYTYSGNVNDLNRCFADSVYAKNDNDIVKFGDKLCADEKFAEVCEINSKTVETAGGTIVEIDYRQYVYGNLACAKYRKGDKEGAVSVANTAMEGVQGFPVNNALAILSLQAIQSADKETAQTLKTEVEKFTPAEAEKEYYDILLNELTKVGGQEL